ncbi:MAG: helix-turn-helix transcriptional regulator [Rhizobiales bacterium]|nr:helix-turn-helix transcriptional regulator [Hyphomicrobiales bacterium]
MQKRGSRRSGCPISYGLDIFGDKWTLLVMRDMLMRGKSTYREFVESEEGIASNILAERLSRLECAGLIRSESDPRDARQKRYSPTKSGRALFPVLVEMVFWGAIHDKNTGAPESFVKAYRKDRDGLVKAMMKRTEK